MRKWLARLGFPLLVLAVVLAWEGRRASTTEAEAPGTGYAKLYYAGAAALGAAGVAGVRERHRRDSL